MLSGGRVDFGIGIGWLREEYEVLNVPFERRGKRADEYLTLMRSLWSDGTAALSGEFYELPECRLYPKPLQSPVPVHVGGESGRPAPSGRTGRAGSREPPPRRRPHRAAGDSTRSSRHEDAPAATSTSS